MYARSVPKLKDHSFLGIKFKNNIRNIYIYAKDAFVLREIDKFNTLYLKKEGFLNKHVIKELLFMFLNMLQNFHSSQKHPIYKCSPGHKSI